MKKIIFTILSIGLFFSASAQKLLPEIKAGTTLSSHVYVQGQELPLVLTLKTITAPVVLNWAVDGYGEGSFEMSANALEKGTAIYMGQPGMGLTKLADNETYGLISKAAFKSLIDTKAFTYNGATFKVKSPATVMKLGTKEADVIHVVNDQKIELWILNNPNMPLILQTAGLPIDVVVVEIK